MRSLISGPAGYICVSLLPYLLTTLFALLLALMVSTMFECFFQEKQNDVWIQGGLGI